MTGRLIVDSSLIDRGCCFKPVLFLKINLMTILIAIAKIANRTNIAMLEISPDMRLSVGNIDVILLIGVLLF